MKYVVVRRSDGFVANVIVWDGVSPYNEDGHDLVPFHDAPPGVWIGWHRENGEWIAPPPPEELPSE